MVLALVALVFLAASFQLWRNLDPAVIVTVGLVLSIFSGNWGYLGFPFGIDRLIVLAGIAAYLVRIRRGPWPDLPAPGVTYWLLALALTYAVLSAIFAGTIGDAINFYELMDAFGLVPFVLFGFAALVFDTPERREILLKGLIVMGAYLGVTAVCEGLQLNALVFPRYILNDAIGITADRARGPFLESGANGAALIVAGVACAIGMVKWPRRNTRLVLAGILALCAAGVLFTLTRQVWLGAVVGVVAAVVATPGLRRYLLPGALAAAVLVVALFALAPGLRQSAGDRYGDKTPVWDRENSNRAGLNMLAERPLLGFGWGTFYTHSEPYFVLPDHPVTTVGHIHNVFLSNFVSLGLIGGILWLVALLTAFVGALRRRGPPEFELWRAGFFAVGGSWLVIAQFTPLTYGFANSIVWLWAGLLFAGHVRTKANPVAAPAAPPRVPAMA